MCWALQPAALLVPAQVGTQPCLQFPTSLPSSGTFTLPLSQLGRTQVFRLYTHTGLCKLAEDLRQKLTC